MNRFLRSRLAVFALSVAALVGLATGPEAQLFQVEQTTQSPSLRPLPTNGDDSSLLLGNPSSAEKSANNYLLQRPQHTMSYNASNGRPNWVAWHLDLGDLGKVKRGDFTPDSLLPSDWQIRPSDYRGSGYDRGHVCPKHPPSTSKYGKTWKNTSRP